MSDAIRELRRQAESAVQDMDEGALKLRAFEVILGHLLHSHGQSSVPGAATSPLPTREKDIPSVNAVPRTVLGRLSTLKTEEFFSSEQSIRDVQAELRKHGWHYPLSALSGPLQKLVQKRTLRRQQSKDGNRKIWRYSDY